MSKQENFVTSTGRLLSGDLYKANDKDATGSIRLIKSGPNQGKPMATYEFAVAFPKNGSTHWSQLSAQQANGAVCPFGQIIYQTGVAGFPQGQHAAPTFAWKVTDGDSQIPNSKGRKPCDREGFPGHWVFWFSSQYAPKIVNKDGSQYILEEGAVKRGYYVQVAGSVSANGDTMKPGVYLNHNAVSLQGYGEEIVSGPDPSSFGFGASAAPAAMTQAPTGPSPVLSAPGPQRVAALVAPVSAAPTPTVVAPHPGFLAPPVGAAAPAPAAPPAPVPPKGPVMTPAAGGVSYDAYIAAGWTDAQLRAHGFLAA